MKIILSTVLLALTFMAGCGFKVDVDPIKVDGKVDHIVTINAADLMNFYKAYCESKFESQGEIDQCMADEMARFWAAFEHATNPQPSPSPSP